MAVRVDWRERFQTDPQQLRALRRSSWLTAPDDLTDAELERFAVDRLVSVAAILFDHLPPSSLVRRLLEAPLYELGEWAVDARYYGPLGGEREG